MLTLMAEVQEGKPEHAKLLGPRLKSGTQSLLPPSIDQSKSWGGENTAFKRGTPKSQDKGHKKRKIGDH